MASDRDKDATGPPLTVWLWTGLLVGAAVAGLAFAVLLLDLPFDFLS
jgi:hypothetical protein